MEDKKRLEPKLRFPGYTDDWEQHKLVELYETACSGGTPKSSVKRYYEGDIPFLGIADIDGRIVNDTKKHISEEGLNNSAAVMIPPGTISLAMYASVGKVGITSIPMTTSQAFYNMTFSSVSTRNFVYTVLEKMESFSEWESLISTGTQRNLNADKVKNLVIKVPSEGERKQIGLFFQSIDNLITLHQRKLECIKEYKKGMLQKMFPKNGETVPEVRFPGFTGEWKHRPLGDVGTTYTGLSGKTKKDFGHGEAKFVTYMNVYSNPIADPTMVEPIEIDSKQKQVEVGDVFFTTSSETPDEVGMSSVLLEKQSPTYLNSFCFGYRPTEQFDPYYLAYMFRSEAVRKNIILLAQGISRYNISKNKMMEIEIPIPSLSEQEKIGVYFKDLDNLITLHQQKLDALKEYKKGMLQQMFV